MKSNVKYSTSSWVLTIITTAVLLIGLAFSYNEPAAFYPILAIIMLLIVPCLFFAPISLSADKNNIKIHSLLKVRTIPISEIAKIERFKPLNGTIRICASGGFMGYWGTFRDSVTGIYTGYWGNGNDCFMLTLTNGKKYLLGCNNPDAMLDYIKSMI